jgi:hypothetical protein
MTDTHHGKPRSRRYLPVVARFQRGVWVTLFQ